MFMPPTVHNMLNNHRYYDSRCLHVFNEVDYRAFTCEGYGDDYVHPRKHDHLSCILCVSVISHLC